MKILNTKKEVVYDDEVVRCYIPGIGIRLLTETPNIYQGVEVIDAMICRPLTEEEKDQLKKS